MRMTLGALLVLAAVAVMAQGADAPASGLAPGSEARAFDVYHAVGPRTGQTMCYT